MLQKKVDHIDNLNIDGNTALYIGKYKILKFL